MGKIGRVDSQSWKVPGKSGGDGRRASDCPGDGWEGDEQT